MALVLGDTDTLDATANLTMVPGRLAGVEGHLGRFRALAANQDPSKPLDLGPLSGNAEGYFDLIVDLSSKPVIPREVPPFGYVVTTAAVDARALTQSLAAFKGYFSKPKYFVYDADLCAHSRQGLAGCQRCLQVCPADALSDTGETVTVDLYLCQGCGGCTQVCPSGALRYPYPTTAALHDRLRHLLRNYRDAGGKVAVVVFHDVKQAVPDPLPAGLLPVPVHAPASIGMETWFTTLAYGAAQVTVCMPGDIAKSSKQALENSMTHARDMLAGMGQNPERIRLEYASAWDLEGVATDPVAAPGSYAGLNDKRSNLKLALEHLVQNSDNPATVVALTSGAPTGNIQVNRELCTLCGACARICPPHALRIPRDTRGDILKFTESLCVQCGLCAEACPEAAIHLEPGMDLDIKRRATERILNEPSDFILCHQCGAPVMSMAMWKSLELRLGDTTFFSGEQKKKLLLCEQCRARETMEESI